MFGIVLVDLVAQIDAKEGEVKAQGAVGEACFPRRGYVADVLRALDVLVKLLCGICGRSARACSALHRTVVGLPACDDSPHAGLMHQLYEEGTGRGAEAVCKHYDVLRVV
jgi:hypothetical protein